MSQPPPEIDEADLHLQRLVRLDMLAVEHVHAALLDATEPAEIADMARAYTRVTRSARQHLALHAKLKRDRAAEAREAEKHEAWKRRVDGMGDTGDWRTDEEAALEARAQDLSTAVSKVISKAAAGDRERHTALVHRFDRELDDWYEDEDFLDVDLDAQVAKACYVLGLPADLAARWRDLPQPTFFPEPEVRDDADEDTDHLATPAPHAPDAHARDTSAPGQADAPPPWSETG